MCLELELMACIRHQSQRDTANQDIEMESLDEHNISCVFRRHCEHDGRLWSLAAVPVMVLTTGS